jgi:hypothetical protein
MTPRLPVASIAVFNAASTASKPELLKMTFPDCRLRIADFRFDFAQRFECDPAQLPRELRLERMG